MDHSKLASAILTLTMALASPALAGPTTAEKCEAAKNKEAGKYAFCRQKAEQKAIKKAEAPDYSKCDTKLLDKWTKAEQKAIDKGEPCIDSISGPDIQSFVTTHSDAVAAALGGGALPACGDGDIDPGEDCDLGTLNGETCDSATASASPYGTLACSAGCSFDTSGCTSTRFIDNGDGTVTDNQSGLMWEQKVAGSGCPNCVSDTFTWDEAMSIFLGDLNQTSSAGTCDSGFAGYCDWRLPTEPELASLLDCSGGPPCIDPIFGPTQGTAYHTGSLDQTSPSTENWKVDFFTGNTITGARLGCCTGARAVRDPN